MKIVKIGNESRRPIAPFLSRFDQLHAIASQATGLDDFGPDIYHEPLKKALSSLDEISGLNALGIQAFTQQVVGSLVGRLLLHQGLKTHSTALDLAIERPIFILGMGRTGTTVLHRVLSQDPALQSLPFWLGCMPMPRPPRDTWTSNPFYQQVCQGLATSPILNDDFLAIHPIAAEKADECRWALEQSFWSSSILFLSHSQDYASWYRNVDATFAYEYYRRALSLVANGDSRQWVLKDPAHMFGIDALLSVFPDACIVQTHREPVESMRSFCNLGWQTIKLVVDSDKRSEQAYGAKMLSDCSFALRKMESVRRQHDSNQFMDLHMHEIRTDPIASIERIFEHFNLPVTKKSHAAWQLQLSTDPNAGHAPNHSPPDFGLTRENVNATLGDYYQRYLEVCENAKIAAG